MRVLARDRQEVHRRDPRRGRRGRLAACSTTSVGAPAFLRRRGTSLPSRARRRSSPELFSESLSRYADSRHIASTTSLAEELSWTHGRVCWCAL
jgi:hypothetical protein